MQELLPRGSNKVFSLFYSPHPDPLPKGIGIYTTFQLNKNNSL